MYSRFDIVWPDTVAAADHPTGVDALSYGLATLVMGEHVFRETLPVSSYATTRDCCCPHCGCNNRNHQNVEPTVPRSSRLGNLRLGNYYARYTRKFSVGNGPSMWVQEYSILKETGKMLGTLVALAVARMVNLESFIWDMPTGVMRDVFLALGSLADRPGHECRLENVWIRWHDNSDNPIARGLLSLPANATLRLQQRYGHVEYPTFSVLPPLKSLSVLDIDEPAYLDEMAVLIERSRHKLRELRIGMAIRYNLTDWVMPAGNRQLPTAPSERPTPGWPRVGGVLSILLSKGDDQEKSTSSRQDQATISKEQSEVTNAQTNVQWESNINEQQLSSVTQLLTDLAVDDRTLGPGNGPAQAVTSDVIEQPEPRVLSASTPVPEKATYSESSTPTETPDTRLKLEVFELERVYISAPVLLNALNWRQLTTLTLLHCDDHEQLWRGLRRQFSPSSTGELEDIKKANFSAAQYPLRLKHLHTDRVSPYLILFLKEAIAPNSMESVYFQEGNMYESIVGIDAIYRHVLRRQRRSLQKVLIDRSRRYEATPSSNHGHWRNWMLPPSALAFVTSGQMPRLRELGIGMDRRDWVCLSPLFMVFRLTVNAQHFFLQRLPNMPALRTLYLPNMYDPTLAVGRKHRELALQILDIVTLRPEIKLCYVGIEDKCFEILESSAQKEKRRSDEGSYVDGYDSEADSEDPDENEEEGDHDGEDPEDEDWHSSSDEADGSAEEDEQNSVRSCSKMAFKIREILFYDDKVSIFKARHCQL
jgi:hypothetical protein